MDLQAHFKREQRLMLSAWYDLGIKIQRKHAMNNSREQVDSPSSWLAKQRKNVLDSPVRGWK